MSGWDSSLVLDAPGEWSWNADRGDVPPKEKLKAGNNFIKVVPREWEPNGDPAIDVIIKISKETPAFMQKATHAFGLARGEELVFVSAKKSYLFWILFGSESKTSLSVKLMDFLVWHEMIDSFLSALNRQCASGNGHLVKLIWRFLVCRTVYPLSTV